MKQNMFLIKEKPHNVVEKPTHRAGNKMWENWMEKEMEIFPNFILEKKQKSTIFEFIINPKNGQPILEHDIKFATNGVIGQFADGAIPLQGTVADFQHLKQILII